MGLLAEVHISESSSNRTSIRQRNGMEHRILNEQSPENSSTPKPPLPSERPEKS